MSAILARRREGELGRRLTGFCTRNYVALLLLILVAALFLRAFLAMNSTYLYDEHRDWIRTAVDVISFDPDALYLPLRTEWHNALVAYVIKLGSYLGDGSHFSYRWTSVAGGVLTVACAAEIARRFAGPVAGLSAALILAFNEYHIVISSVAVQLSYFLLFSAPSILFFLDYLDRGGLWRLTLAAAFAGLSFLAYEVAALTIIFMFVYGSFRLGPSVIFRREVYVAAAVGAAIVLPDLLANAVQSDPEKDTYGSFINRIESIGFNPQFLAFLVRDVLHLLYPIVLGRPFVDDAHDYDAMNPLFGIAMGLAVLYWIFASIGVLRAEVPRHAFFHAFLFVGVLTFFVLIETANNYVLWFWVLVIVIPGSVLVGGVLATAKLWVRIAMSVIVGGGLVISVADLARFNYGMSRWNAFTDPSPLHGEQGSMVEVDVHFDACDLCRATSEFRLVDVVYVGEDQLLGGRGREPVQALFTPAVEQAEPGTDDRSFRVLIPVNDDGATWMLRQYQFLYDVVVDDRVVDQVRAVSFLPVNPDTSFLPIFWLD